MARPLDQVARSYAAGVEALFEPPAVARVRAPRAALSADLAARDRALDAESAEFIASAQADFQQRDKVVKEEAAVRLLAKAVVDLDVAGSLLEAAASDPAVQLTPATTRVEVSNIPQSDLDALTQPPAVSA